MDGVRMEFSLQELPRFMGAIDTMIARGEDVLPLMTNVARYGEDSTKFRFEDGIGPDGAPWKPSIRARNTGGQTLVDQGNLRDSISSEASRDQAVWGTNLIYAGVHQDGAVIAAKNAPHLKFFLPGIGFRTADEVTIPARPFIGINADDEAEIGDLIVNHFLGGVQ